MTRVAYVATRCILDRRSGASVDVKATFEHLAMLGFECHSITMTRFDGDAEFPIERLVGLQHSRDHYKHHFLEAEHRGVCHRLFCTESTLLRGLTRDEGEHFAVGTAKLLAQIRPEIVLTTGVDALSATLHEAARRVGATVVFYLANPGLTRLDPIQRVDEVWCPTRALADYYREALGVEPRVVRNVLNREHFLEHGGQSPARRGRSGYITLINPAPEKGATLFFALARLAARQRPDLRFLAVEARMSLAQWRTAGCDRLSKGRLHWIRNRRDMRPVYRRTAVLLAPSFCFEAAGRTVAEAQLSGIPVIASNRGGLPEQLNGGGYLVDPPPANLDDFLRVPSVEEVRPWLDRVTALVDDPRAYEAASERATAAATLFHPDHRLPALAEEFAQMLGSD